MELVIVALIGFAQAVTLTILGFLFKRLDKVKKDTEATKDQIVNHHPTQPNFREESDRRHDETKRWFSGLAKLIRTVESSLNTRMHDVEKAVTDLVELGTENRQRIIHLEDTDRLERKNDESSS